MDLVGPEHKADATRTGSLQHAVQNSQNDSLPMMVIQQPSPTVYRNRDEMGLQGIIKDATFCRHGPIKHPQRSLVVTLNNKAALLTTKRGQ